MEAKRNGVWQQADLTKLQQQVRLAVLDLELEDVLELHEALNKIQFKANQCKYAKYRGQNV